MKLKKVKVLCMITAIGAAATVLSISRDSAKSTEIASDRIETDAAEGTEERDFSETIENVSFARMILPDVASANEAEAEDMAKAADEAEAEDIVKAADEAEAEATAKAAEKPVEDTLIIAEVDSYVNIRSMPGMEGEILGKLYDDSVGQKLGEENDWYYITSGTVTGYVKAEYVLTGEAARTKAEEVGKRLVEVTTTTLKVRKEASAEATVLGLVPGGDILSVKEETEGWIKVSVEEGEGYVSADYVRLYTENVEAESKEEEEARLRKEEEARKAAEEAARKAAAEEAKRAEEARKAAQKKAQNQSPAGSVSNGRPSDTSGSQSSNTNKDTSGSSQSSNVNSADLTDSSNGQFQSSTDLGRQIADYALKFLGNPYVYGGTSLTNGTDCSGFVQSVYKHFGISLPRTSGEQGASGRLVDGVKNAQPGDLVWYSGHIGIYIGNEQIVHASNSKVGIITSNVYYRDILGIRRII